MTAQRGAGQEEHVAVPVRRYCVNASQPWCANGFLAQGRLDHFVIEERAMPTVEPTAKQVPNLPPGFDFTDPDVHAERLPVEELAELRRTAPIWWNDQPNGVGGFVDGGFWVVSPHKDVQELSGRSDVRQHTPLVKIISRGFPPRAVGRLPDGLHERAQRIVADAAAQGSGDFV